MNATLPSNPFPALGVLGLGLVVVVALAAAAAGVGPQLDVTLVVFGALAGAAAIAAVCADPAWAISAGVAASMFSGRWDDLGSPLPLDRALFLVGIAALVLRLPLQWPRMPQIRAVHVAIALASAFAIGSAAAAGTLTEPLSQFELLDRHGLIPFAAFLVAPVVFRTSAQRMILLWCLAATGLYLSVTALFEALGWASVIFPAYIGDPSIGYHFGRARGPFVEAGALGLALWGCGVATVVLAVSERRPLVRLPLYAIVVLCSFGLLLTETRAVWLAAVVSVAVVMVVTRDLRRFLVPVGLVAALGVVAALAVVPGLATDVQERRGDQGPVWDRLNSNAAAVRMLEARPLAGFGWGRFEAESEDFYRLSADYPIRAVADVHNVVLSNLAEIGLIGTTLWIAALLLAVGGAAVTRGPPEMRPWQIGMIAIGVNWAVTASFTPLSYVFPNLLLWTWAGVVFAAAAHARGAGARSSAPGVAVEERV